MGNFVQDLYWDWQCCIDNDCDDDNSRAKRREFLPYTIQITMTCSAPGGKDMGNINNDVDSAP